MIRFLVATPLLTTGGVVATLGDIIFNLGAIVAGSNLRK